MAEALLQRLEARTPDAARLIAATRPLHARGGCERSVRLIAGELLDDRFLLSFPKRAFGSDPDAAIARLAAGLSMPAAFAGPLTRLLPAADILHLGYEGTPKGTVYKLYLEFAAAFRAGLAGGQVRNEPLLLHHAFKWDPAEPHRHAVALYKALPCRGRADMERGLALLAGEAAAARTLGQALLERALRTAAADDLLLMAVEEPGNPRRSFDLNLYPAGIALTAAMPLVEATLKSLAISRSATRRGLDRFGDATLGHVAGGQGRGGEDFATIYFGAEPIQ